MINRGGFLKSIFGGVIAVAVGRLILKALPTTVPPVAPVTAKIFYLDYRYNPLYKS
jgi:hypothetical protein